MRERERSRLQEGSSSYRMCTIFRRLSNQIAGGGGCCCLRSWLVVRMSCSNIGDPPFQSDFMHKLSQKPSNVHILRNTAKTLTIVMVSSWWMGLTEDHSKRSEYFLISSFRQKPKINRDRRAVGSNKMIELCGLA